MIYIWIYFLWIFSSGYVTFHSMGDVKFTIEKAAKLKNIENPFALSRATGLGYAICYRLWNDEQRRVDLNTLASLCDVLECQPGDLLIYVSGGKKGGK
jgi:DNA-binding Xre family transcriptional regulator